WRTACMACPLLDDAWSLVPNSFDDKREALRDPRLVVIASTRWMAARAAESAILGGAAIHHLSDALDLGVSADAPPREALRHALGLGPENVALLLGEGAALPAGALRAAEAAVAPSRLVLLRIGAAPEEDAATLVFGDVADPAARADLLAAADLALWPDGAEGAVLESLAAGTPCLVREGSAAAELCGEAGVPLDGGAEALRRFLSRPDRDALRRDTARRIRATHAPGIVGPQLAALYADGSRGRQDAAADPVPDGRVARLLAAAPVPSHGAPGADLLRFPFNRLLAREAGAGPPGPAVNPPAPRRLLAVRARFAHHAAVAGPYHFLRHLPPRFEPECWTVPLGNSLAPHWLNTGAGLGRLLGARTFGHNANAWEAEAELLARLAAAPVEIVHVVDAEHGGWLLPQLPAALFAEGRRPHLVATFHQPPALLLGQVSRAVLRRFDAVIVLCEYARRGLAGLVPEERLHVVPHGVDTGFFTPGPGRAPDGTLRLLAVGSWLRDYPAALDAFARLRARGVDARYTIVWGDFPGEPPEGVTIAHGLSDEALRQAYHDADALFMPLADATANNAILEAMACGRPVVTTDVGGVREAVGEAAILCPRGDAGAMAEALEALARDPTRRAALGRAARARAEALDWSRIGARHAAIYEAVLAAGERGARRVSAEPPPRPSPASAGEGVWSSPPPASAGEGAGRSSFPTGAGEGASLSPSPALAGEGRGGGRPGLPHPPAAAIVDGRADPPHRSAALAAILPPRLTARRNHQPRALAPDATRVAALLEAGDMPTLLTLLGEALLGGGDRDATLAAARQLLLHLARHPLQRDPGLGALAAALSE
ncbi:MAG TPA: glycosyltransferase, partial [Acetobacteraceae bacterium]|nr:glycosyltransferase [Acetobacteraceae bacterium]